MPNSYQDRAIALAKLGYKSYSEYLRSPLWKAIRRKVLKAAGEKCVLCKLHAFTCHHQWYSTANLDGSNINGIVPICRACHRAIEFDGDRKRSLSEVEKAYKLRRRDYRSYKSQRCPTCGYLRFPKACYICRKRRRMSRKARRR